MEKLSDYLRKDLIKLELSGNTKLEVISELVELLKDKLNDTNKFLQAVIDRESAGSTAMEHGLCIPHARSKYVNEFAIAVGCKPDGIDCDSLDGKKSTLFFLIASNDDTKLLHLDALVKINQIIDNDSVTDILTHTNSREGFIELIKKLELR